MKDTLSALQAANPGLHILLVEDAAFGRYGRVLKGYDPAEMIARAKAILPASDAVVRDAGGADAVVYEPSVPALEKASPFNRAMAREVYGGMPVQVGWCYGKNLQMDALEYHKGIEVVVCLTDVVLLVGDLRDVVFGDEIAYDTSQVAAFYAREGSVVEFYAWNLHYAPIHATAGGAFATLVYLPKGTNEPLTYAVPKTGESRLLFAVNKWLIAHPEAKALIAEGAYVGISGENLRVVPA